MKIMKKKEGEISHDDSNTESLLDIISNAKRILKRRESSILDKIKQQESNDFFGMNLQKKI